jgi:hypothetical protein
MGIRFSGVLLVAVLAVAVAPQSASAATASFEPRKDHPAGYSPFSVAVDDLNRDGRRDMAVVNQLGDSVSIFISTGTGGLSSRPEVRTGSNPLTAAVADLNGDRRADLVTANTGEGENGHSLSIALGRGDGRFAAARHLDLGGSSRPWGLVAEDFDDDGDVDLAVTLSSRSQIQVLSGNGRGGFVFGQLLDAGFGSVADLRTADLNRDGVLDLVAGVPFSSDVLTSLGQAGGTFGPIQRIDVLNTTSNVVVADFTSDTVPDLVVARTNSFADSAWLLTGNGDGTFGEPRTVPVRWAETSTSGDFDGDGREDLAFATSSVVFVLLGNGDGTFQESLELPVDGQPGIPATVDLDRDGKDDLVVPNGAGLPGTLWLYVTT